MVTTPHIDLELNEDNPLTVLTDAVKKKKAVFIITEVKQELQNLCNDYPDIKMMYFASDAIKKAIEHERTNRNV